MLWRGKTEKVKRPRTKAFIVYHLDGLRMSLKANDFMERSKMLVSNLCKKSGSVSECGSLNFRKYKWFYY